MKRRLDLIFRSCVFALVALLLWAVWTEAQTNTVLTTNATPRRTTPNAADSGRSSSIVHKDQLTFGLDEIDVLNRQWPSGIPLWQYFASLIYIFLAFCVSKLLDSLTRVWLKKWAEHTKTKFDDLLIGLLSGPLKVVVFVIFLKIGLEVFDLGRLVNNILDKGLKIIVAATITYAVLKLIDLLMGYWKERAAAETDRTFDEQLFPIIRKTLKVFVTVVAALVTSQNLGFDIRSEEHTSELQSLAYLVCRLLLEKKKKRTRQTTS